MNDVNNLPENWLTLRIEDIAKDEKGAIKIGPFGSQLKKEDFVENGIKVYDQETAFTKDFYAGSNFISNEKFQKLKSCEVVAGDLIISMMGTIGAVAIVPNDAPRGILNSHLLRIRPNKSIIREDFLKLSIAESPITTKQLKTKSHGGIMSGLSAGIVRSIELVIPPLGEQKKIAEILSTWDKSIETTEKLIAAKQKLKKSLMQRLLTGSQRFPEFHRQEWTKHKIADLFEEVTRYVKWNDEHSYKLVSIRRRFKGLFPRGDFFGHQIGVKKLKSIHSEDFLISKRQVSHGAWGVVTLEFHDTKVSDEYDSLIVKDKTKINIDFWGWLCKTPQMQRYSYLSSNGVHIEKLIFDFNDFRKRSIYVPSSIEEQKKIAAVLNACDAEINVLQNELDALRHQKRGLMQKLLTGRVRVKVEENGGAFEAK